LILGSSSAAVAVNGRGGGAKSTAALWAGDDYGRAAGIGWVGGLTGKSHQISKKKKRSNVVGGDSIMLTGKNVVLFAF
jgi:hypothetical protein